MLRRPTHRLGSAAALLLAAALLAGCAVRGATCGEYPQGGGPPVVRTHGQRICAVVRAGAEVILWRARETQDPRALEVLHGALVRLSRADTVAEVAERVRGAGFESLAREVEVAAERVRRRDEELPPPDDAEEAERRLARGAALGLRLALEDVHPELLDNDAG